MEGRLLTETYARMLLSIFPRWGNFSVTIYQFVPKVTFSIHPLLQILPFKICQIKGNLNLLDFSLNERITSILDER